MQKSNPVKFNPQTVVVPAQWVVNQRRRQMESARTRAQQRSKRGFIHSNYALVMEAKTKWDAWKARFKIVLGLFEDHPAAIPVHLRPWVPYVRDTLRKGGREALLLAAELEDSTTRPQFKHLLKVYPDLARVYHP